MSESKTGGAVIRFITHIRSLLGAVFVIVHTFLSAILVMSAGFLGLQDVGTWFVRQWSRGLLFVFGIQISVEGTEFVPAQGGGIMVFNHQSHFDIPVICCATDKKIRFGAKVELFKIPFFGTAMRAVGTLPIARESRSEVLRIYKDAEKKFQQNFIFVLAPEGTRQKEPVLGRFKKGPFIFAKNAGVPIIPVVLRGAHAVLPKKSLGVNLGRWTRTVHVRFLAPFETRTLSPEEDIDDFVLRVRDAMNTCYESLPAND